MTTVLAFGDSLTFGAPPTGEGRHNKADRWPEVVAAKTGFDVISDGLRGRTTALNPGTSPANLSGTALLATSLHTHAPVDLLAIMLGTNDCVFGVGARRAQGGLARLVEIARHHPFRSVTQDPPQILLIAPPPMIAEHSGMVSQEMIDESEALPALIAQTATTLSTAFFDAGTVAQASPLDGIHLDAANTRAIGAALAPVIANMRPGGA